MIIDDALSIGWPDKLGRIADVYEPREMRAEIAKLRGDIMVRSVMESADFNGATAEDRYTMLAYYALKELSQARKIIDSSFMASTVKIRLGVGGGK